MIGPETEAVVLISQAKAPSPGSEASMLDWTIGRTRYRFVVENPERRSRGIACPGAPSMARSARAGCAAREMTAHDCVSESVLHSSFCTEPNGAPSSK